MLIHIEGHTRGETFSSWGPVGKQNSYAPRNLPSLLAVLSLLLFLSVEDLISDDTDPKIDVLSNLRRDGNFEIGVRGKGQA